MKQWLLLLLLLCGICVFCQPKLRRDTAFIQPRAFNDNAINNFKKDKDFKYTNIGEPAPSLWRKFWDWVWWQIHQLMKTKAGRTTVWSLVTILAILIIVFFILKLTGMDQGSLFARKNTGVQSYNISTADINKISFEDEIEKALNSGNYRLAIRLQYLQALKKLSDKSYIDWRINKTNSDYINEVKGKTFEQIFINLTKNFEYIWYGEKQISKEQFLEIKDQYQQFNSQLSERI